MKPGRKKGTKKTGGRSAGTPNRTTKEARDLLEQILFGQIDNIKESLEKLRGKDDFRYIESCSKLFTYVLPKKTDITSGGKELQSQLPAITIKTKNA